MAICDIINNINVFHSLREPNQWLQVNFKNKVKINSYIMKYPNDLNNHSPSNFILEISLNGSEWKEIDRQNNINFFGKDFKQNLTNFNECIYARIKNIGKNVNKSDELIIQYLEFFGSVLE